MLQLPETHLDQKWQNYLDTWQKEINAIAFYPEKVEQAKAKYESKIKTVTFKNIRGTLETMCSGNRRCCYCEDSCADEVEHIRPKSLYPELVFVWENYLYSCGLCNPKKNNHYAVIVGNEIQPITRKKNDPIVPPSVGKGVFINPRIENPLDFLELDLGDDLVDGTFLFQPRYGLTQNSINFQRANYTIQVLDLNRDVLLEGRRNGALNYRARLIEYQQDKSEVKKRKFIENFKKMSYPTVWQEMKKQRQYIPSIDALIKASPEILDW